MLSKLCVGAVSPMVVEEAARLNVPQIVASRRQVDIGGGYTGMDQEALVQLVRENSSITKVVRDHGGPLQGGNDDDGIASFEADVSAGFDVLHIDVCQLPEVMQVRKLAALVARFQDCGVDIEIGGEHNTHQWNKKLVIELSRSLQDFEPSAVVVGFGSHVWADRQGGNYVSPLELRELVHELKIHGLAEWPVKAHNMDWIAFREAYVKELDLYNIAPEYGVAESDAWLRVFSASDAIDVLNYSYESFAWRRWFNDGEGTNFERARCAFRYLMTDSVIRRYLEKYSDWEDYVRLEVRYAIAVG